jgi:lysophospholipase L1-like esterase
MHRYIRVLRTVLVPFAFVVLILPAATPTALAESSYSHGRETALVGPKSRYLALGDSLAFGIQPDLDFAHGYANYFMSNLAQHGVKKMAEMGCPDETSSTFIDGGCSYAILRKYPYSGSQLDAALNYIRSYRGQVSPVTLDIGASDLEPDIDTGNCSISASFSDDLARVDANVKTILQALRGALTVNGRVTGDIVVMNYYDPYQNICPNTGADIQKLNAHLAMDVQGYGVIADVFGAFGGSGAPNNNICSYTWMCSIFKDIHATDKGYSEIAGAFEKSVGY